MRTCVIAPLLCNGFAVLQHYIRLGSSFTFGLVNRIDSQNGESPSPTCFELNRNQVFGIGNCFLSYCEIIHSSVPDRNCQHFWTQGSRSSSQKPQSSCSQADSTTISPKPQPAEPYISSYQPQQTKGYALSSNFPSTLLPVQKNCHPKHRHIQV